MTMPMRATLIILACLAAAPSRGAESGGRDVSGAADFSQHLGRSLPVELRFRDERGASVRLRDYLGTSPLGLVFAYFTCSNLCPMQIRNLAQRLAQTSDATAQLAPMLVVSIDPLDTPASADRAKHKFLDDLSPAVRSERWHFLSGAPEDIARLSETLGFRYGYDRATQQYAHPAGFAVITPEGKIARYFFGFGFTAGELAGAFDQAADKRIASPIERLLLVCFHYDVKSAPHSALIIESLRAASIVMLLALAALAWMLLTHARRARSLEG